MKRTKKAGKKLEPSDGLCVEIDDEMRKLYYRKWFARDKELNAREALEEMEYDDFSEEAKRKTIALDQLATTAIDEISTEIDPDEWRHSDDCYLGFKTSDEGETLCVAMLFQVNDVTLEVKQIAITCQGVLSDLYRTKDNAGLFKKSIDAIRIKRGDLKYLSIDAQSEGSKRMLKEYFPSSEPVDGLQTLEFVTFCVQCKLVASKYRWENCTETFCGINCAEKHWLTKN